MIPDPQAGADTVELNRDSRSVRSSVRQSIAVHSDSILKYRRIWGFFLVLLGAYGLIVLISRGTIDFVTYSIVGMSAVLILSGVGMMFYQMRSDRHDLKPVATGSSSKRLEAEHAVEQLSRNYDVLRRQTTQGFYLSGGLIAIGFLIIGIGLLTPFFGFQLQAATITTTAGIVLDFIGATALLVYRLNFKRLNETTDKLDRAWRILTAHRLSDSLPEQDRAESTKKLIDALVR